MKIIRMSDGPAPMRAFGPITVIAAGCALLILLSLVAWSVPALFIIYARLIVAGVSVVDSWLMFRVRLPWLGIVFVAIAVLLNPILIVGLPDVLAVIVYVLTIIFLAVVAFVVRGPGPEPDDEVVPGKRFL